MLFDALERRMAAGLGGQELTEQAPKNGLGVAARLLVVPTVKVGQAIPGLQEMSFYVIYYRRSQMCLAGSRC